MAIPNFDALNVKLSRMMEDAVSAATTDGDGFTSAYRDKLLNDALRRLQLKWWAIGQEDALRGYTNVEAQSLSSSELALSTWTGGVVGILSVYNATDEAIPRPISNELKEEAQTGNNKYISSAVNTDLQHYYINDSNFTLINGTATSSIRLTYIKQHTDLVANTGSTDIAVPSQYWEVVLKEAIGIFWEENPSKENVVKMQLNG
jgi:hypothetical protein